MLNRERAQRTRAHCARALCARAQRERASPKCARAQRKRAQKYAHLTCIQLSGNTLTKHAQAHCEWAQHE